MFRTNSPKRPHPLTDYRLELEVDASSLAKFGRIRSESSHEKGVFSAGGISTGLGFEVSIICKVAERIPRSQLHLLVPSLRRFCALDEMEPAASYFYFCPDRHREPQHCADYGEP